VRLKKHSAHLVPLVHLSWEAATARALLALQAQFRLPRVAQYAQIAKQENTKAAPDNQFAAFAMQANIPSIQVTSVASLVQLAGILQLVRLHLFHARLVHSAMLMQVGAKAVLPVAIVIVQLLLLAVCVLQVNSLRPLDRQDVQAVLRVCTKMMQGRQIV
jgi:hypothetical protein